MTMQRSRRDQPRLFFVHASNLDAVDFTGLALLACLLEGRAQFVSYVDHSLDLSGSLSTLGFDPRLAVPGKRLLHSPDSSIRQETFSLRPNLALDADTLRGASSAMPGRFQGLYERSIEVAEQTGLRPAASFLRVCFQQLRLENVYVSDRPTRAVGGPIVSRVLERIRAFVVERGITETSQPFAQGGAIELADGRVLTNYALAEDGELLLRGGTSVVRPTELRELSLVLRGPLDVLSLACAEDVEAIAAHHPFFLGSAAHGGPLAVEIAHSLFVRYPETRPRELIGSFSGVLLDEYAANDSELDDYVRQIIGPERWIFDAIRWIGDLRVPTNDRWAWDESHAAEMRESIRRLRPDMSPVLGTPLGDAINLSMSGERVARDAFHGTSPSHEIDHVLRAAGAECRRWKPVFDHLGVPSTLEIDGYTLEVIRRRAAAAIEVSSLVRRAGLARALSSRLLALALRTIGLVGDTVLRASIPTLAMAGSPAVLRNTAKENEGIVSRRADAVSAIQVI